MLNNKKKFFPLKFNHQNYTKLNLKHVCVCVQSLLNKKCVSVFKKFLLNISTYLSNISKCT